MAGNVEKNMAFSQVNEGSNYIFQVLCGMRAQF